MNASFERTRSLWMNQELGEMAPYRTYATAFTLPRGTLPDALYWDMADPYHYVRLNRARARWIT